MNFGEKNVGTIDRVVRIIVGIAFLAGFALNMVGSPLSYLVTLVGIIALVTGALGTCPAYKLMGISTAGKKG
jgi:Inner membrane protein YgaP-like, transmembrane domain